MRYVVVQLKTNKKKFFYWCKKRCNENPVSCSAGNYSSWIILFYKGLKGKASIPTEDLIPMVRRCRNHHSSALQVPIANIDIYKCSFFPQTIRDWNKPSLISAERVEDGVAKFTSLVRDRD